MNKNEDKNLQDLSYNDRVLELTEWFEERLPEGGLITISQDEYEVGIDSFSPVGFHGKLRMQAFDHWLRERHYELSYNQMCIAFFQAARNLDLLAISK